MSRAEKIIIIVLIALAISAISISYYRKLSQKKIQIIPLKAARQVDDSYKEIANRKIVNINTADETILAKLPGIGPFLSRRIIEYRNKVGRFNSPDKLLNVKGVGPVKYQSVKEYIKVDE